MEALSAIGRGTCQPCIPMTTMRLVSRSRGSPSMRAGFCHINHLAPRLLILLGIYLSKPELVRLGGTDDQPTFRPGRCGTNLAGVLSHSRSASSMLVRERAWKSAPTSSERASTYERDSGPHCRICHSLIWLRVSIHYFLWTAIFRGFWNILEALTLPLGPLPLYPWLSLQQCPSCLHRELGLVRGITYPVSTILLPLHYPTHSFR